VQDNCLFYDVFKLNETNVVLLAIAAVISLRTWLL